jgi:hypothetical protein
MVVGACRGGIGEPPSPMAKSFRDRIAESLDHPIEAACAARAPATIWAAGAGAGVGAAIGSVGGGPLAAGIGAAIGVCVAYLILWISLRGSDLSLGMALTLTADRLEIHRVSALGTRAVGLIRAIPYAAIRDVRATNRWLEVRLEIVTDDEALVVHTSKRGVGAGRDFADQLKRRIAA